MKIIETIALITINETLYFQLLSFLLFLFILNRIMIRPLRRVMGEREALLDRISQDITDTEQSFHDVEHQIELQENEARREAFKIRDQIEASGQHTADDLIAKTREEIDALKAKAHAEAAEHLRAARLEIQKEAAMISEQMIASLLGRRSAS
jgi:F-type H+-transporting ATPase subunit b